MTVVEGQVMAMEGQAAVVEGQAMVMDGQEVPLLIGGEERHELDDVGDLMKKSGWQYTSLQRLQLATSFSCNNRFWIAVMLLVW